MSRMQASTFPMLDVAEAAELVLERTRRLETERVHVGSAYGRVLGEDLLVEEDLPRFPASAVDGFAVRSEDGPGRRRLIGESAAGRPFAGSVGRGEACRTLTGAVLPSGADCMVMVEDTVQGPDWVEVGANLRPGANYHPPGSDARRGQVAVAAGTELRGAEIGIAATLGHAELTVVRRPLVAVLSTGDELVEVGTRPGPGQIVDSNRWALTAAVREAGADVTLLGIGPDEEGPLRELVTGALRDHDVLVTSGGVSVGSHDLVKPLLASLGEVLVGRVRLKPGKPFTFATLPGGRRAFGLPGFPVSSLVTFEVFVRPALRKMQGFSALQRPRLQVRLGYDARPAPDRTEYQRVVLRREGSNLIALTTGGQSSSRLLSAVGAQALVRVSPGEAAIRAGTMVEAIVLDLPA
ncbi:MAG: molybdopterin molybdotransferase MoeA [Candidatus Dormibacteraceae bacterium]